MSKAIVTLVNAILAVLGKIESPVLITEEYYEDYEYGTEEYQQREITNPNEIAHAIAEYYDYDLDREGELESVLDTIRNGRDGVAVGWCGETHDGNMWLTDRATLDAEAEKRREKKEREAVKAILAQHNYDIKSIRKACREARANLEHEEQREDWMCECHPTPQGFADAQDLRNERIGEATQRHEDMRRALELAESAETLRNWDLYN